MAILNKKLTPPEIAAIYYHVFGGVKDWILLYAIADGIKDPDNINRSTVYKWKNSAKIVDLIRDLQRTKQDTIQRAIEAAGMNADGTGSEKGGNNERAEKTRILKNSKYVDYSDPSAQRAKLNELVNTATEPGEALDALKVIISGQRADRDAAKEGRTVRAYLPVSCHECPLYEKLRKKDTK